ncbi:BTB/POZ domain-containing protein 7 isoform X2 [Centroberyx affinis]|uniref:BTB/POZ domain-containing protein 7 isoform X2 n=1 Tax=Centroberyx affinis TaxID=166261 RepID=UPI003A5BDED0
MGVSSSLPHSCSPRCGLNQTQTSGVSSSPQCSGEGKLYGVEPPGADRPLEKKKKSSGLATLRRRFIKRRKSGRSADHGRQMRELLWGWEVCDVGALVEEYEGTAALKELSLRAGLARAGARSLRRDLAFLYRLKFCTDVDLIFQGRCFPAHRAVLAARCPFFKTLLASSPGCGAQVLLDVGGAGMDAAVFSALLHYLYSGELGPEVDPRLHNMEVLLRLSEEFGTPNCLEQDMRSLWEHMSYFDSLLYFLSDSEQLESFRGAVIQEPAEEELRAHKAILSARSPFFRNLLQRRLRSGEEVTERAPQTPTRIILDESIIPKKYARVILHCMYTDTVELGLVLRGGQSAGSLGEVQTLVAGGRGRSQTEEAMELHHIALFLEFSMLAQGCEDIVVESLSLDSLAAILKWSSQPYGSKWVYRQAMHFLCEMFSQVTNSDVLYELSKEQLLAAVQSDYLQASELDVLRSVVKWGEQQLMKRMAEREPNLLSGTAHSLTRRGVKRRDLDQEELKEILSSFLPHLRIQHILPANSELLHDAMKRGLVSTPPADMLPAAEGGKASAWLKQRSSGIYIRPRLFSPYHEEARAVLDELLSVEQRDAIGSRTVRMSNVPDALYMINNAVPHRCHTASRQQTAGHRLTPPSLVADEIPVPRLPLVKQMIRRLRDLRRSEPARRAAALNRGDGAAVAYELRVRVLREFGLPDAAAELLQNPNKFFPDDRFGDESPVLGPRQSAVQSALGDLRPPFPPPPPPYNPTTAPSHAHLKASWRSRLPTQVPSRSMSYPCNSTLLHPQQGGPAYPAPPDLQAGCSPAKPEPVVNRFVPDIAMGLSALTLREPRPPEVGMETDPRPVFSAVAAGFCCPPGRPPHPSRKRHAAEPKAAAPPDRPDPYEFSYGRPDPYGHGRPGAACHGPRCGEPLPLGDLEHPPHRLDLALANQGAAYCPRSHAAPETDLTCNPETTGGGASEERLTPPKPDCLYRKSAL